MEFKHLVLFCLLFCNFANVESFVMGIDFGTEWFKVAIVKPKMFEVVLNEQSARKTAASIAFQKGDLVIGTEAKNLVFLIFSCFTSFAINTPIYIGF